MSTESIDRHFLLKPNRVRFVLMNANHPAPRTVSFDVRVTVPAHTPMRDVAQALTDLATAVRGVWTYRQPEASNAGRFEVGAPS
jgi:hypothetical protein